MESLDPRIARSKLETTDAEFSLESQNHFPTFEVFHQKKRGAQHQHVGIVHAPNPNMAMLYAKEQYARRGKTSNLWVVPSSEIYATEYFDEDMFENTPEKKHRDPTTYKVMDKIKAYKDKDKQTG